MDRKRIIYAAGRGDRGGGRGERFNGIVCSVLFLFEEVLPLFAADTCALIPLVGKRFTTPDNPDSFRIVF